MIRFGTDNFTVTLEWSQFSGETYSVASVPESVHVRFTTNTSVQLVLLYNTQYNVIVTATLCGYRNATTNLIIYYGNNHTINNECMVLYYVAIVSRHAAIPLSKGP
jgi:hypothetical protein